MAEQVVWLVTDDDRFASRVATAAAAQDAQVVRFRHNDEISVEDAPPDLLISSYAIFQRLRSSWPRLCGLLYATAQDSEMSIEVIKAGALDLVVLPVETEVLSTHIREALRISRDIRVPAVYDGDEKRDDVDQIIGQSPAMKEVYTLIGRIAPRDINVLVTGESGTGKELVARAILHHSTRRDKPYLAVNCAAIPETLLESELFGHEKGAFTGAAMRRIGKFEQCHEGTLFLDEIGDIPLATQAKLLRVLQDHTFQRLGGTELVSCDVRIVAATHQPLEQLIEERRFRQDLFYRLKVAHIHVPPLREREVDVVLLAHHFLEQFNRMLGTNVQNLAPETLPVLLRYGWPGNVRELENAIKSALVLARGTVLRPEFLPEPVQHGDPASDAIATLAPVVQRERRANPPADWRQLVESLVDRADLDGRVHAAATKLLERELILACLKRHRGRIAPAARHLGISPTTLRKKMGEHAIEVTASLG